MIFIARRAAKDCLGYLHPLLDAAQMSPTEQRARQLQEMCQVARVFQVSREEEQGGRDEEAVFVVSTSTRHLVLTLLVCYLLVPSFRSKRSALFENGRTLRLQFRFVVAPFFSLFLPARCSLTLRPFRPRRKLLRERTKLPPVYSNPYRTSSGPTSTARRMFSSRSWRPVFLSSSLTPRPTSS